MVVTLSHNINNHLQAILSVIKNVEDLYENGTISISDNISKKIFEDYLRILKSNAGLIKDLTTTLSDPSELEKVKYIGEQCMFVPLDSLCPPADKGVHGEGKRILVAEDKEEILEACAIFLRGRGYIVDTAKDGFEALNYIYDPTRKYAAVVSDIKMPGPSGYIVYCSADEADQDTAVLLMTAFEYDPNHVLPKARKEGLDIKEDVLRKPFRMEELLSRLEIAIEKKKYSAK
jgi:two-component system, sensor histidine kinase ChiS